MFPRFIPIALASLALAAAACGSASSAADPPTGSPASPAFTPMVAPAPTPVPVPPAEVDPEQEQPTPLVGDVDGAAGGPELTIEQLDAETIQATIADAAAKAWRLVVAGTGERGGDRWEIVVETGDTGPLITATEIVDGRVTDVMDLSGFADETAAAGGCHSTLPVCLDSDGFRLPQDGDGRFSVRLQLPAAGSALVVRGSTARWDREPFVLGPWHQTEAFPWGEG